MSQASAQTITMISIESSRSRMEVLDVFKKVSYPNETGPGIHDIHSACISTSSDVDLLRRALHVVSPKQLFGQSRLWT